MPVLDFLPAGLGSYGNLGQCRRESRLFRRCASARLCRGYRFRFLALEDRPRPASLCDDHRRSQALRRKIVCAGFFCGRTWSSEPAVRMLHFPRKCGGAGFQIGQDSLADLHDTESSHYCRRIRAKQDSGRRALRSGVRRRLMPRRECFTSAQETTTRRPAPPPAIQFLLSLSTEAGLSGSSSSRQTIPYNIACVTPDKSNCPKNAVRTLLLALHRYYATSPAK